MRGIGRERSFINSIFRKQLVLTCNFEHGLDCAKVAELKRKSWQTIEPNCRVENGIDCTRTI